MMHKNITKTITIFLQAIFIMYSPTVCIATEKLDIEAAIALKIVKLNALRTSRDTFAALNDASIEIQLKNFIFNNGFIASDPEQDNICYVQALRDEKTKPFDATKACMQLASQRHILAINSIAKKFLEHDMYANALKWYIHSFYIELLYNKTAFENTTSIKLLRKSLDKPGIDPDYVERVHNITKSLPRCRHAVIALLKNRDNGLCPLTKMFLNSAYLHTRSALDDHDNALDYVRYNLMDAYSNSRNDGFFDKLKFDKNKRDQRIIEISKQTSHFFIFHYIGGLYKDKHMGPYLTDVERYELAEQYYQKSKLPDSVVSLIDLYENNKIGQQLSCEHKNLQLAMLYLEANNPDYDKKFVNLYYSGKLGYNYRDRTYMDLIEILSERDNIDYTCSIQTRTKLHDIKLNIAKAVLNDNRPSDDILNILKILPHKHDTIADTIDNSILSVSLEPVKTSVLTEIPSDGKDIVNNLASTFHNPSDKFNCPISIPVFKDYDDVESSSSDHSSDVTDYDSPDIKRNKTGLPVLDGKAELVLPSINVVNENNSEMLSNNTSPAPVGNKIDTKDVQLIQKNLAEKHQKIPKIKTVHYPNKKNNIKSNNHFGKKTISEQSNSKLPNQPLYHIFFANSAIQSDYHEMIKFGYGDTLKSKIEKIKQGEDKSEKIKNKLYTLYKLKINDEHRIVYTIHDKNNIIMHACMKHYDNLKIGTDAKKFIPLDE